MNTNLATSAAKLIVPSGTPDGSTIEIPIGEINQAESRLPEVRFVNETTGRELAGHFNQASSLVGRYLSIIRYEILKAQKALMEAKADVIIDQAPIKAKELKEHGIKMSEDIREAMTIKDPTYSKRLDVLHSLTAVETLLQEKSKTFSRAYYACDAATNGPRAVMGKKINGNIGMLSDPQTAFMGRDEHTLGVDPDILEIYSKK